MDAVVVVGIEDAETLERAFEHHILEMEIRGPSTANSIVFPFFANGQR